jgi:hypothetical protein
MRRIDLRLTEAEYCAIERLAQANGLGLADAVRAGVLYLAASLDEDGDPPILLGGSMMICDAPSREDFLPPKVRPDL